jgi:hypothetical protein
MHRSDEAMIFIGNFNKNSHIFRYFQRKSENFVLFAYTYVSKSPALFYGNFCINLYFVDSNEALKLGDEVLNASLLHRYTFLLRVRRFIAITFKENCRLTLHHGYFFKEIHRTLYCHYFLK